MASVKGLHKAGIFISADKNTHLSSLSSGIDTMHTLSYTNESMNGMKDGEY